MNNNNDNEIKKANQKAKPKFIIVLIICSILGGVVGFFSAKYGVDALVGGMKSSGEIFGLYIAPWLMLALAIALPIIAIPLYKKAKKLIASWDCNDDDIPDAIDKNLSILLWITSAAIIVSYFLIAASYSGGFAMLDKEENILPFFISVFSLLAIMVEAIIIQQKCVDSAKKINPEKAKASIYDVKFQKKWLDSCDEAEKIMIGKCAYKAFSATNTVCAVLAIVLAIAALIFGIGFLPSLTVCIIWIVNQSVYCKEALKSSTQIF